MWNCVLWQRKSMFWLYKDGIESWFSYCLYLEVRYGWAIFPRTLFWGLKWVSQKRNCLRFRKQRQSSCHYFLKVSLVRRSERKLQRNQGIPNLLDFLILWRLFFPPVTPTPTAAQAHLQRWRQQLSLDITAFPSQSPPAPAHILFQAPNLLQCFRRLAGSLCLILQFPR